jgi:hypothetical protein
VEKKTRLTVLLGLPLRSLPFPSSFHLLKTLHVLFKLVRLARGVHLLVMLGGGLFLGFFPVRRSSESWELELG